MNLILFMTFLTGRSIVDCTYTSLVRHFHCYILIGPISSKNFFILSLSLSLFCLHFTLLTTGRDIELEYFLCSFFYEKEFNNQLTDWDSIYSRFFTGGFEPLTSALCSGKQCVWIQNFPYIQIAYTYLFGLPIQLNMKPVVQCDPCLKLQKVRSVIIPIL